MIRDVTIVHGISGALAEFVRTHEPVLIKGAVADWKALNKWTIEHLMASLEGVSLQCRLSYSGYFPDISGRTKVQNLKATLLDFMMNVWPSKGESAVYLIGGDVINMADSDGPHPKLLALLKDASVPKFINPDALDIVGLWISSKGAMSWLHYDENGDHNFNAQVHGKKDIFLISPNNAHHCKMKNVADEGPINFGRINVWNSREVELLTNDGADILRATLDAGDAVYIPPHWLHSFAHRGELNINVNFWWGTNFRKRLHVDQPMSVCG